MYIVISLTHRFEPVHIPDEEGDIEERHKSVKELELQIKDDHRLEWEENCLLGRLVQAGNDEFAPRFYLFVKGIAIVSHIREQLTETSLMIKWFSYVSCRR